jgi:hypothetical protein
VTGRWQTPGVAPEDRVTDTKVLYLAALPLIKLYFSSSADRESNHHAQIGTSDNYCKMDFRPGHLIVVHSLSDSQRNSS